jgi:hypothetical protein
MAADTERAAIEDVRVDHRRTDVGMTPAPATRGGLAVKRWGRSHHGLRVAERCAWRVDRERICAALVTAICADICTPMRAAFSNRI